jgi:ribosomal protein L2
MKGTVIGFEYDPQRTTPLAKVYSSNEKNSPFTYHLATEKRKLFQTFHYFSDFPSKKGDVSKLKYFEPGDFVHSVDFYPQQGVKIARSAGSFCQIRSNYNSTSKYRERQNNRRVGISRYVKVRLPSGSQRLISPEVQGVYGIPEFDGYHQRPKKKAGRTR